MNSNSTTGRRTTLRHAFSLIETVLALGIMGLAITALLGLLPHGIEMSRKAANASASSRIIDTLQARLASNSFKSLLAFTTEVLHFDDQGVILDGTGDLSSTVYIARVKGGGPTSSPKASLPGGTAPETTLLRFEIEIAPTPNLNFNFDTAPPNSYDSTPILIGPMNP